MDPSSAATTFPREQGMPKASNGAESMSCPIATTMRSQATRRSGAAAARGAGLPHRGSPMIWGCTTSPATRPSASHSTRTGALSSKISHPSAWAPAISASCAVMSQMRRRYATMTLLAPRRTEERATSMATLPPPTTMTRSPEKSGSSPSPMARSMPTALSTPRASSPGSPSFLSRWAPMAR